MAQKQTRNEDLFAFLSLSRAVGNRLRRIGALSGQVKERRC